MAKTTAEWHGTGVEPHAADRVGHQEARQKVEGVAGIKNARVLALGGVHGVCGAWKKVVDAAQMRINYASSRHNGGGVLLLLCLLASLLPHFAANAR
jgi:hypothetical protein